MMATSITMVIDTSGPWHPHSNMQQKTTFRLWYIGIRIGNMPSMKDTPKSDLGDSLQPLVWVDQSTSHWNECCRVVGGKYVFFLSINFWHCMFSWMLTIFLPGPHLCVTTFQSWHHQSQVNMHSRLLASRSANVATDSKLILSRLFNVSNVCTITTWFFAQLLFSKLKKVN